MTGGTAVRGVRSGPFKVKREALHTLVGAAVVLLGAVVIVTLYRGGQPGKTNADGYQLTASFRSIDGITAGSDVLLAGIKVGEVESQHLDLESNSAVVVMRIREGIGIPYDSSVKVLSNGMAGGKYLKISPGGDFEMLPPGGSIDFTQSAIRFEELLQNVILTAESRRRAQQEGAAPGDGSEASDDAPGLGGFGLPSLTDQ